jgi:thiamine transport system ATP-binding protein
MLRIEGATVQFGDKAALDGVNLEIADGARLSVLGPSGSGKSTLLRAIAGLEPLAQGRISWNGRDLAGVPVHERGFGLMFQDYVLFPHLDVGGNVRFGLDMARVAGPRAGERVAEVLALVGLAGFESRLPSQLSGGEQQRVALARALAPQPRLLMLDEPLGALDRSLRRSLLDELSALFEQLDVAIVYVTHDHEEALAIGDRVCVMRAGRVEAVTSPEELWRNPPTEFVARFLGFTNLFGSRLLRPDAFRPEADGSTVIVVRSKLFRGDHTLLKATVVRDGSDLALPAGAALEIQADWAPPAEVGQELRLAIDPRGVVLLEAS